MKPNEIRDQPSNAQVTENAASTEAGQKPGRTGPIDDVKRDRSDEPGENAGVNDPQPPCSKSGK
jgi:hypothetical protein